MTSPDFENGFLRILKRLMLVAIGSGLITNALYIYGLAYYEGYLDRIGFEYDLFPISWDNAVIWTYHASRELGVSSIVTLSDFTVELMFIILFSFYFIARVWMELSSNNKLTKVKNKPVKNTSYKLSKKIYHLKTNQPWAYYSIYLPIKWVLVTEKSFIAFAASYFFMVFLFFIPVFIIIWVYFPMLGVNHGKNVAIKHLEYYKESLCGGKDDYWSECIEVNTEHIKIKNKLKVVKGSLMFRSGDLLGILTETGPITITIPKPYYYRTEKNPKFTPPKKSIEKENNNSTK